MSWIDRKRYGHCPKEFTNEHRVIPPQIPTEVNTITETRISSNRLSGQPKTHANNTYHNCSSPEGLTTISAAEGDSSDPFSYQNCS